AVHLRLRDVVFDGDLNDVHVVPDVLQDRVSIDLEELLLDHCVLESRIESVEIGSALGQLPPRRENPRSLDASGANGVSQSDVAIDTGVAEIANGGEAALEILSGILGA